MMCRSRYLTADGRVLRCLLNHRKVLKGRYTHRNAPNTTTAGMQWINEAPCRWEAPDCWSCEGSGRIGVDDHERDCPTCDGSGVDESVPLTLVGEGSKVRARAKTKCREVFLLDVDTSPLVLGYCTSCEDEHTMDLTWHGWQVVRAVPPAHTGDTP